jgi:multidrug transporter EmrE-like cation transporter
MKTRFELAAHLCVLATLLLTVYGQLVLKWQITGAGPLPEGTQARLLFLGRQLLNPWILSGFAAAFLASMAWMMAMTRLELGYAYPFMSLAFVLVMLFGVVFLNEPVNAGRIVGTLLVIGGLVVIARS